MKKNNAVRRPQLAHSSIKTDKKSDLSIGDTMRKAQKNLLVSRIVTAVLIVLVVALIAVFAYLGYFSGIVEYISEAISE